MTGRFCAACGQRDIPAYPSVRELATDAVAEFSGWDGRLASTLRSLVQRPGLLTREFLEGRRVRYISPLRVYLLASLAYFVIAAAAPNVRVDGKSTGLRIGLKPPPASTAASRPQRVGDLATTSLEGEAVLTPDERKEALADIAAAPAVMRPFLSRVVLDPVGFRRGVLETMPRMLFALLPVFAGIVALFYRGRKYPEHLYFAIHLHAFIFLALAVGEMTKFLQIPVIVVLAGLVTLIWIPIYATLAFRRVYGGSLVRTLMKEAAIAVLYAATAAVAFIIMIYWVSIAA